MLKEGEGLFCNSNALHSGYMVDHQDCHYISVTFSPRFIYGYENSLLQTKFVDFITSNESWHSLKLSPDTGWQQDIIRDIQRIYELSQVDDTKIPSEPGYQIPFRHLCNYLQIYSGDQEKVLERLSDATESQKERLRVRMSCAWAWLEKYAPEEFCFSLSGPDSLYDASESERAAIRELAGFVSDHLDGSTEKEFSEYIYKTAADNGMENPDFFRLVYMVLIGKEKGPKLAGFLKACGSEKVLEILRRY